MIGAHLAEQRVSNNEAQLLPDRIESSSPIFFGCYAIILPGRSGAELPLLPLEFGCENMAVKVSSQQLPRFSSRPS